MSIEKALVVAGGDCLALTTLVKMIRESSLVVAADSGAEHLLRAGTVPDAVIGDLDSCDRSVIERIKETKAEIILLPTEKNVTDTEAAIDYCINKGYKHIDVVCAMRGKRIDHLFGSVFLLPKYLKKRARVRLVDDNKRFIEAIDTEISFSGQEGTFVSIIPLSSGVSGVTTKGLKYPLEDAALSQGNTLGISNEIVSERVMISVKEGVLLIIKERE